MGNVPVHVKFIALFIALSMLVMGVDGLMFDNYNSRPSMALMHMEMKPVIYNSPAPPSLEEYWEKFSQPPTKPSDPDTPMEPEIITENGKEIKVYYITM